MTLKDICTRPRSTVELAEDTGVSIVHLHQLRRNGYGDWPFQLTSQGYVLKPQSAAFKTLMAIVGSTGNQAKIDELLAMMAAEELKRNGNL